MKIKNTIINFVIAVITVSLLLLASNSHILKRIELFAGDILIRLKKPAEESKSIVIIGISDYDIEKVGRWPWKRTWHSAIAKALRDFGAKAVYFDMVFSESSTEEDDSSFEEALKTSGNIFIPYVFPERPYNIEKALLPIERFSKNSKGFGAINVFPDEDGTIRTIPLLFDGEKGVYPHASFKIATSYLAMTLKERLADKIILTDNKNDITIPVLKDNNMIINWSGKWQDSFKHFNFIDVLIAYQEFLENKKPSIDPAIFKDSICLIGISAFGLYDIKPVPLEPEYPGIGVVANTINTIITRSFICPAPAWINILIMFLMGLLPALIVSGENPFRDGLIEILIGIVFFAATFFLFTKGILINLFFPIFALATSSITVGTYSFIRVNMEKKTLFSESITDGLTGLYNIRYFKVLLETEIKMAKAGTIPGFSVVLSDIDHFKKFNDTYGHQVGDLVLKETAASLKSSVRATDIVARYGGEEIILLLKHVSIKDGLVLGEKIRKNLENNKFQDEKNTYSVTASFGVSSYLPQDTVDSVIKRSDDGLYKAKEAGRNRVETIQEIV